MGRKVQPGGILRTSSDQTWRTPKPMRKLVRAYYKGVPFLDPAAPPDNPLRAARFFCGPDPSRVPSMGPLFGGEDEREANRLDGLEQAWDAPWFLNPPFKGFRAWMPKVVREVLERPAQPGLLLLPVNRTEEPEMQAVLEVVRRRLFVRWPETRNGRIAFESSIDGALVTSNPFGSWVLGFGEDAAPGRWVSTFRHVGVSHELRLMEAS